jgi:hypothetical protein
MYFSSLEGKGVVRRDGSSGFDRNENVMVVMGKKPPFSRPSPDNNCE